MTDQPSATVNLTHDAMWNDDPHISTHGTIDYIKNLA